MKKEILIFNLVGWLSVMTARAQTAPPQTQVPQSQGLPLGVQSGALGSNILSMATNSFVGTNQFVTNQIFAIQDQAVTIPDQRLLVQVRLRAAPVMGAMAPSLGFMPVHFLVQQNVVTVVGEVVAEPQKQQIIELVQQTPGVVQVVDKLTVNPQLNQLGLAAGSNGVVMRFGTNFAPTGLTNGINRVFPTNIAGPQELPPAGSQ